MPHVKRVLVFMLCGALVGQVVATLIAPGIITWWNTPGTGAAQSICDLPAIFHKSIDSLVRAQLIGASVGAGIFMILGIVVTRAMGHRTREATTASNR
jgi:hypothetical protein